jgi:hypothetical protein
MRDRHVPRLCRTCQAPMARQEAACWRCGTRWADEDVPEPTLRVITGGAGSDALEPELDATLAGPIPTLVRAPTDVDRWDTEGGSVASEAAAQVHVTTARR